MERINYYTCSQTGDKIDCSNHWGITMLLALYRILSNVLLSRLAPYAYEINGDHQCGFRCHRSVTCQIFCVRQIPEKKRGIR
jgi:hypothetical protein